MTDTSAATEDSEETVWSADTEAAFCEALQLYPPCGRRKIVLGKEGKMYGRNELIALHIFNKTGKVRTRKQVSSHIQVLARKQQRESNHLYEGQSSAQIVTYTMANVTGEEGSVGAGPAQQFHTRSAMGSIVPPGSCGRLVMRSFHAQIKYPSADRAHNLVAIDDPASFESPAIEQLDMLQVCDKFPGLRQLHRNTPSTPIFLVKFWADLSYDPATAQSGFFGTTATYTSEETIRVERSTSVISLGKQVIEKIQVESGRMNGSQMVYQFTDAPMCDYMVKFIAKIRSIESPELVNKVLENFSVVQVLRNEASQEVLACNTYMFEVAAHGSGTRHSIYRLFENAGPDARRFTA